MATDYAHCTDYAFACLMRMFKAFDIRSTLLGFLSGLALDMFLGSKGMHAASCLLIGYLRPYLINAITPKGTDFEISPQVYAQGVSWFVFYLTIAMSIYLTFYFMIEAATFLNFFWLLLKIILSLFVSVIFMLIFLYVFSAKKKRRFA